MSLCLESVESTQLLMKERLEKGENLSHLEYIFAHAQTAGMGRHSRAWVSERGNLYISIYLKEVSLPITWIPHWIATSLVSVVLELGVSESRIQIKWPNDILVDGSKKLAGILCEKIKSGYVIGVGMNIVSSPLLSDRETAKLLDLLPAQNSENLNLKVKDLFLKKLMIEPNLTQLRAVYQRASLLQPKMPIAWEDLQTRETGQGTFIRYGEHGELIAACDGKEKTLYSEEIKIRI